MKIIKKKIVAILLCCIVTQTIQVYAEETQEVVSPETVIDEMENQEEIIVETTTKEEQQDSIQKEVEMKNVEVEPQKLDTTTVHETKEGFTYTLNENNEATITGCTAEHFILVIPDTVDGCVVKAIGQDAFFRDNTIKKLTISENVEEIGYFAFSTCVNMEEVNLPSTVKRILNYAFELGKFTEVTIPEGCECIAVGAFESNVMHEIKIPKSVKRIGYNEKTLENKQKEILMGSTKERIVGYAGSAAEAYANALGKIFVNIEWTPLQRFVLPENKQLKLNERVEFPISYVPSDTYSEFKRIDGYIWKDLIDENQKEASIKYEVVDGKLYVTPTSEGTARFIVYRNAVFNYFDNMIQSNICTITVVDPSKVNAKSITLKDGNNNTINNTTLSYDTYNTGCTYPIKLETNPLDANEDITFATTNENLAKVSKVDGNYVLTVSNAYILTPRTCTITATGKRSGVTATFDVQVAYGGAASITFDSSFENNKQGKVNRIVQNSEYDMPIKVVPESIVNDSTITIIQNPQIVITYDRITSKLKAVGVGTATIKAECKGQSISYDFEVSAYEKKATSVIIDTNDKVTKIDTGYALAIDLTDTYQLSATIIPLDTTDIFKWAVISENGVVSIDKQGNITALKAGTATIKASSCSYLEEIIANAQSEYLTVTVTDPNAVVEEPEPVVIHATNYVLNNKSTTMKIGQILQLNPVITPINTTDKIVYKTNDSTVATISDTGLVTVVGVGTTWVSGTVNGMWQGIKITVEKLIIQPSITLSTTSLSMKKGEIKQLSATLGANTLPPLWESNNASIITIAGGVITAIGTGTTYVQASSLSADGSQYATALCEVTVTADNTSTDIGTTNGETNSSNDNKTISEVKAPGNITLNASKFNIQKGKTTKALVISSSTYDNDNIVSVTSSNSKILKASVSNGKIVLKGVKTSNKYVTVTIKTESGAMATSSVKVVKNKVNTSKLKLTMKKVTLAKGESTTLSIIKTPISATDKLTWTSSKKKVATVNKNGKIVAKKKGSATITLKSSNGKKVTCKVIVK